MTCHTLTSRSAAPLTGTVDIPGDKSISHRALILATLAEGSSQIEHFLAGEDCLATAQCLRAMGAEITQTGEQSLQVVGKGLHGLRAPSMPLDVGNSGTTARLLSGVLAAQSFPSQLIGDASLSLRPMQRIKEPLERMGASIQLSLQGTAPIDIAPVQNLCATDHILQVASAQVKSCILLAGLYAEGETSVLEPVQSRDHTERMLEQFAYPIRSTDNKVRIQGGKNLKAADIAVPGDMSSAMFFIVAASICPGSHIHIPRVGINPTRIGGLDILRRMGAQIHLSHLSAQGPEPVADIEVTASRLQGIEIGPDEVPAAIDEFPALFIAAACAEGKTVLTGASELRVKESDRIQTMARGLQSCGIQCEIFDDGIEIDGGTIRDGTIDAAGDHRIAMAFAVAGAAAEGAVQIRHSETIASSFPGFTSTAQRAGLALEERRA